MTLQKTVKNRFLRAAKRQGKLETAADAAKRLNAAAGYGSKRDPNLPRLPRSAFLYFSAEERRKMAEGEVVIEGDVMKAIGKKWRELTQEERKPFDEQAAEDKQRLGKIVNFTLQFSCDFLKGMRPRRGTKTTTTPKKTARALTDPPGTRRSRGQ